jgi:hypothetical protein
MSSNVMCVKQVPKSVYALIVVLDRDALKDYSTTGVINVWKAEFTQRSCRRSSLSILRAISDQSSGGSFLELDVIVLSARGRGE